MPTLPLVTMRTLASLLLLLACPLLTVACPGQNCGRRETCPSYDPQPTTIAKPDVIWIPSPSFNSRNLLNEIDSVVIHTTEVSLAGTLDIFRNRENAVSAHFVIAANGDIYQMVDTKERAWHATYYNDRSIGIEMVGYASQRSTWNANNLSALTDLMSWLMQAYPHIPLTRPTGNAYDYPNDSFNAPGIVAHGQVQPWNRTDPGPYFPWNTVLSDVADRLAAAAVPEPSTAVLPVFAALATASRLSVRRSRPRD